MASKTLVVEILTVSAPSYTKTPKGGYSSIEIAYKNQGKIEGKKLVDFNNKEVFNAVQGFKAGDIVTVVSEKGENDKFWNWSSVSIGGTPQSTPSPAAGHSSAQDSSSSSTNRTGRVTGSNYETPEERALRRNFDQVKHRQIGRQGCLNTAVAILSGQFHPTGIKKSLITEEVIAEAEKLEAFVFSAQPAVKGPSAEADEDIPF